MALLSLEIPEVMAAKKPPLLSFFSGVPIVSFSRLQIKQTLVVKIRHKGLQKNEIPKGVEETGTRREFGKGNWSLMIVKRRSGSKREFEIGEGWKQQISYRKKREKRRIKMKNWKRNGGIMGVCKRELRENGVNLRENYRKNGCWFSLSSRSTAWPWLALQCRPRGFYNYQFYYTSTPPSKFLLFPYQFFSNPFSILCLPTKFFLQIHQKCFDFGSKHISYIKSR